MINILLSHRILRNHLHIRHSLLLVDSLAGLRMDLHYDTDRRRSLSVVAVARLGHMGHGHKAHVWVVVVRTGLLVVVVYVVHTHLGHSSHPVVHVESVHDCNHEDYMGEEQVDHGHRSHLRQEVHIRGHGVENVDGMSCQMDARLEYLGYNERLHF